MDWTGRDLVLVLNGVTLGLVIATAVEVRAIKRTLDETLAEVRKPRRTGPPISGTDLGRLRGA